MSCALIITVSVLCLVRTVSSIDPGAEFPAGENEGKPFIESVTVDRDDEQSDPFGHGVDDDDINLPYQTTPPSDGYFAYREFQDRCPKLSQDAASLMTDLGMKSRYSAHFQPDFVKMRVLPIFETLTRELDALVHLLPSAAAEAEQVKDSKPGDLNHPATCFFICEEILLRKKRPENEISAANSQKLRAWVKAGKLGTAGTGNGILGGSWDTSSRFSYLVSQANLLSLQPDEKQHLNFRPSEEEPPPLEEEPSAASFGTGLPKDPSFDSAPPPLSPEEVFKMLDDLLLEEKDAFPTKSPTAEENANEKSPYGEDPLMKELMRMEDEDRDLILEDDERGADANTLQKLRRLKFPIPSHRSMRKAEEYYDSGKRPLEGSDDDSSSAVSSFFSPSSWRTSITSFLFGQPESEDDSMAEIEKLLKELMGDDFPDDNEEETEGEDEDER